MTYDATIKTGILLVNLGTPKGTDYWSIRQYLSEFLSDKRVIEMPSWLWQPILQAMVLTFRPFRLSRSYNLIWNKKLNQSPLAYITENQSHQLNKMIFKEHIIVDWAMRYGEPEIGKKIKSLIKRKCEKILILPLYPQYSATTTATVNDAVFKTLLKYRVQPAIQTIFSFAGCSYYIAAIKASILEKLSQEKHVPERIILSFHGLPQKYVDLGDPYEKECNKTAQLLRQAMGYTDEQMPLVYQSKFGPSQWLEPNIIPVIKQYIAQGIKHIAVVAPGFMVDCLETLEEVNHNYRHMFLDGGGQSFTYIPCLNDSKFGLEFLYQFIMDELNSH